MSEYNDGLADDAGQPQIEGAPNPAEAVSAAVALPACLLAWAIPGLGHLFLRRFARGALFGVLILALFAGGLLLDGKVYRPVAGEPLTYLAALGASGVGVPFVLVHYVGLADGQIDGPFFDYGNTFTLVAGLLNLLVVLDAFDIAAGRR